MSKLPAQAATEKESNTGCQDKVPCIPIQAADGAIANVHPNSRFEVQVYLFEYGYIIRQVIARGDR